MWNYYNSNQKLSQPWGEVTKLPRLKLKKINWMIHLNKCNDILQVQFKERDSRPVRPIYLSPMHLLIGLIHVNFSGIFPLYGDNDSFPNRRYYVWKGFIFAFLFLCFLVHSFFCRSAFPRDVHKVERVKNGIFSQSSSQHSYLQ